MITELRLKQGSSSGQPPLTVKLEPSITIFVGPNNSGKSLALRELFQYCQSGEVNTAASIVDRLVFATQDKASVLQDLSVLKQEPRPGETVGEGNEIIQVGGVRLHVPKDRYLAARESPNNDSRDLLGGMFNL